MRPLVRVQETNKILGMWTENDDQVQSKDIKEKIRKKWTSSKQNINELKHQRVLRVGGIIGYNLHHDYRCTVS